MMSKSQNFGIREVSQRYITAAQWLVKRCFHGNKKHIIVGELLMTAFLSVHDKALKREPSSCMETVKIVHVTGVHNQATST
jgi:hypothetical protein